MAWCLVKHRDNFTFSFTYRQKCIFFISVAGETLRDQAGSEDIKKDLGVYIMKNSRAAELIG
jgi:hypothetical protein